jgi:hypothetical protein
LIAIRKYKPILMSLPIYEVAILTKLLMPKWKKPLQWYEVRT